MSQSDAPVIRDQDKRGVVTLTLNRPQSFNALSEGMMSALQGESMRWPRILAAGRGARRGRPGILRGSRSQGDARAALAPVLPQSVRAVHAADVTWCACPCR